MDGLSVLEIEPGAQVVDQTCPECSSVFRRVTGFLLRDRSAHAVYFASCYHHGGHEAWVDAVFSPTWAEGIDDRETFGCRVGPVDGEVAVSLVTGAGAFRDSPTFGHKLTRDEALSHPRLGEFWELVDHVLKNDPVVRDHVYGPGATFAV